MNPTDMAEYDIKIRQGATFQRIFTWTNPPVSPDTTGVPLDLTGWTGKAYVEDVWNGDVGMGGAAGTIEIIIPADDTAEFDFDSVRWFLRLIDGAGTVVDLLGGSATLERVNVSL